MSLTVWEITIAALLAVLLFDLALAIVRFENLSDGVTAATAIVRSGISIARCEFLDAKCIKNVNAHDGLTLTEVPTLFFEFHGSPQGVAEDAESVKAIVEEFGGSEFEWTTDEGARRKLWQARHNAYWAGIAAVSYTHLTLPTKRIV